MKRSSEGTRSLPVIGSEENLLLGPDDDIAVMLHDIGDEGDDRQRHGRG